MYRDAVYPRRPTTRWYPNSSGTPAISCVGYSGAEERLPPHYSIPWRPTFHLESIQCAHWQRSYDDWVLICPTPNVPVLCVSNTVSSGSHPTNLSPPETLSFESSQGSVRSSSDVMKSFQKPAKKMLIKLPSWVAFHKRAPHKIYRENELVDENKMVQEYDMVQENEVVRESKVLHGGGVFSSLDHPVEQKASHRLIEMISTGSDPIDIGGQEETQLSYGGEADLIKHFDRCLKNPKHEEFVPVNGFTLDHLPEGFQDPDLLALIKVTADLTVRVSVQYTSPDRPRVWPGTDEPYPHYDRRGGSVLRIGTGRVRSVSIHSTRDSKGACQCQRCQKCDTPSSVWGQVDMCTAAHLVFDDSEAGRTSCRLFYDREDSAPVLLGPWTVRVATAEDDRCWLTCVTCDVKLLAELDALWKKWVDLYKTVSGKYKNEEDVRFNFIVSHPHGRSKKVTCGRWVDRVVVRAGGGGLLDTKYTGAVGHRSTPWGMKESGYSAMSTVEPTTTV